jgi:DNA-3-methyladenine glycosylase II
VDELSSMDRDLARVVKRIGPPPLWNRPPGFPTLVHIILEQQVSLASARVAFNRLGETLGEVTPEAFLSLDDRTLKDVGFSGQKARYCRELAHAIIDKSLDLEALANHSDRGVCSVLESVPGIGPWTATIYLLMALLRPDVWPAGDLALASAVQDIKGLDARPVTRDLASMAESWRPWRSVAARILWHHYLNPD